MNVHSYTGNIMRNLFPVEAGGFDSLIDLAMEMRWSWNHAADEIWRQLDPVLRQLTHHPWDFLQTTSREKAKDLLADPAFRRKLYFLIESKQQALRYRWKLHKSYGSDDLIDG